MKDSGWARNLISHDGEEFFNDTFKLTLLSASQPTVVDLTASSFFLHIESRFICRHYLDLRTSPLKKTTL